jgi:hypothetical protein
MKKSIVLLLLLSPVFIFAQIDRDQLALDISEADAANFTKLKDYIWKRVSDVSVDGEHKATITSDFSFDDDGKVQAKLIDADSDTKQKHGIRGQIQSNKIEDTEEYITEALKLAVAYAFMSKGQLLDFISSATITETEKGGNLKATGSDVLVKGDMLTVIIDPDTKLFIQKEFSSFLDDKNPVKGEINYATFKSGISHGSTSSLDLPAKKLVINSTNQDYSKRVE